METVLYADVLFLVNFAMDFISLSAAATLGAAPKKPLRLSAAAALGAIYGVAATASGMGGFLQYVLAVAVGASMCIIGYGFGGVIPFIRQYIIFWGCGSLLGGIMTAALSMGSAPHKPTQILPTALGACVVLFFTVRALGARSACRSLRITLTHKGTSLSFEALCDSGNLLKDPFSGRPVIIASRDILSPIINSDAKKAFEDCDVLTLSQLGFRARLIPRRGEDGGKLLCAFVPDSLSVSAGKRSLLRDALIAPCANPENHYAGFPATAPAILVP